MEFCAGAEQCGASCTLGGLSGHIQTEALQFKFRARKMFLFRLRFTEDIFHLEFLFS